MRGRVVAALEEFGELTLDELGPRVRVDYTPDGEYGREWLHDLVSDLQNDELVTISGEDELSVRLWR
jgi:A/G-specific adenine glycosylase